MRNTKLLYATFAVALLFATANPAFAVDTDGDGWDLPMDCNDNEASIHPGALEIVGDGIDQDCNAQEVCYADTDNDGARTTATTSSIDQDCDDNFEGRIADLIDCNDGDPDVFPGGTEVCDGGNVDEDCDGNADDADAQGATGKSNWYADADSDGHGGGGGGGVLACDAPAGHVSSSDDCDDGDPDVNPDATEVCDGGDVDDDCDGLPDDADSFAAGKTSWYADADSDGYGAGAAEIRCDPLPNYLDNDDDCDDSAASVHPGGTETCDGADDDEDCDGAADDGDPQGATGKTSWYVDSDDDGYGDASSAVVSCDAPTGTVADATDCDDAAAAISPGDPEICDSGNVDEDCDSTADDADPQGATGKTSWYVDSDDDGYGDASSAVVSCDAPTGTVADATDCDDAAAAISPGDPEICDAGTGVDDDCDNDIDCDDTDCSAAPSCGGTVEVFDHLECFKIKTTEKLKAALDVDPGTNPPFELAAGCTIGKATKYCVPVMKTVAVIDPKTTLTPDPLYEGQGLTDDRICYKVKCPDTAAATITLTVRDRFGNRDFTKFKSSEICTPAEQVP